jgi:hypothetical protein
VRRPCANRPCVDGASQIGDSSAARSRMACQISPCTYAAGRLLPLRHKPPTTNGYGRHPSLTSFLASCAGVSSRALGPSVLGSLLNVIVVGPRAARVQGSPSTARLQGEISLGLGRRQLHQNPAGINPHGVGVFLPDLFLGEVDARRGQPAGPAETGRCWSVSRPSHSPQRGRENPLESSAHRDAPARGRGWRSGAGTPCPPPDPRSCPSRPDRSRRCGPSARPRRWCLPGVACRGARKFITPE